MRKRPFVCTAAALTAVVAWDRQALAESVNIDVGNLTVAATWRAQPSSIAQGDTTTFKLSLKAAGDQGSSGISFGQSVFSFSSGSGTSAPTTAELLLGGTGPSGGSTMTALLQPLKVTYFDPGVHTATISTADAPITWNQGGEARSGSYSLSMGTTVTVGGGVPTLQSVSVPVLIDQGETFRFSALADSGVMGGLSYLWDFDGDGTVDSNKQNPSFAYATDGLHNGLLTIAGAGGSTNFAFTAEVNSLAPAPLPMAVWGGLGLVSALGVRRAMVLRRQEQ